MKRYYLLAALLLATPAHAQRIKDWSLSPEESMRVPTTRGPSKMNPAAPDYSGSSNRNTTDYTNVDPSDSFMAGFCDPNFRPIAGNACVASQTKQACGTYFNLPEDAKVIVNDSIECLYAASESDAAPSCIDEERARRAAAERYKDDFATRNAILNLPNSVLYGATNCMRGR